MTHTHLRLRADNLDFWVDVHVHRFGHRCLAVADLSGERELGWADQADDAVRGTCSAACVADGKHSVAPLHSAEEDDAAGRCLRHSRARARSASRNAWSVAFLARDLLLARFCGTFLARHSSQ
jgi:hypothetical protein